MSSRREGGWLNHQSPHLRLLRRSVSLSVPRSTRHARFPRGLSLSPLWRRRKEGRKERGKGKERASEIRGGGSVCRCSYSATDFSWLRNRHSSVLWRPSRYSPGRVRRTVIRKEGIAFVLHKPAPQMGRAACSYMCIRSDAADPPDIKNELTPIEIRAKRRRKELPSCVAGQRACVGVGGRIYTRAIAARARHLLRVDH